MIKTFLFDVGNVLLPFDFSIALGRLGKKIAIPVSEAPEVCRPVTIAYESGLIGRGEFLEQIIRLLGFRGSPEEFTAIWEDIFTENIPMTDLVRSLHSRYPLYLLSNTNDIHAEYFMRTYPVFGSFSGAAYSYREKCMKPGREIYGNAIRNFGLDPKETVFIDDLAPNVQTAHELGFTAIRYDYRRHGDLLEALEKAGIGAEWR